VSKWDGTVPLSCEGLASWVDYDTKLVEGKDFDATLIFCGFERGRSAAHAIWRDPPGRTFPMFLCDLETLIYEGIREGGSVSGRWTFTKRGANYGIKRAAHE
jgi:hypothetical protein